jgi:hypothetical protein
VLNISELAITLRTMFKHLPSRLYEPLLVPTEVVVIMLERLVDAPSTYERSLVSEEVANNAILLLSLLGLF